MSTRTGAAARVFRIVDSCPSCLSWGPIKSDDFCRACLDFSRAAGRVVDECASCARSVLLKRGHCRLCWAQAYLQRPEGPNNFLIPHVRVVRDHQLFLSEVFARRVAAPRTHCGRRGRNEALTPPPPAARPHSRYLQLPLFRDVVARAYAYGRVDRRSGPAPENGWLAWGLHLAHLMAETRGWKPLVRNGMERTLIMLLSAHAEGDLIQTSDFHQVVAAESVNLKHVNEILTTMGVLVDDRPTAFHRWLAAKTLVMPAAIGQDVRAWATALHHGSPRALARNQTTARGYLYAVAAALSSWPPSLTHLREVTRADVEAYLQTLDGYDLAVARTGLRSLFGWAKKNKVIFRDPTGRIHGSKRSDTLWQPLLPEEIRPATDAAITPQARLIVALAAIHAARPGQIRALHLHDIDLPARRLSIAGHDRPLDDLTHTILLAWLDHRRENWPHTANTHLLISQRTAVGLGPVSHPWAAATLRNLPAGLDRLRIDRQLEEAVTGGADPLHVATIFGIATSTAIRYATNAAHLLPRPHQTEP